MTSWHILKLSEILPFPTIRARSTNVLCKRVESNRWSLHLLHLQLRITDSCCSVHAGALCTHLANKQAVATRITFPP